MDCLRAKAKLAPRDITILARTTPEDRMLDGKRYYRAFPDEKSGKAKRTRSARCAAKIRGAISQAHHAIPG